MTISVSFNQFFADVGWLPKKNLKTVSLIDEMVSRFDFTASSMSSASSPLDWIP